MYQYTHADPYHRYTGHIVPVGCRWALQITDVENRDAWIRSDMLSYVVP